MNVEATFVILFAIATGVAMVARRLDVPYTVALVFVGLALGGLHLVEAPHLTKELLFALFLPGLLFDAAFNLDAREFWHNKLAISALAVPGVVLGIVITGMIATGAIDLLSLDPGFTWQYGLVFGALIAATDPIAVVGLFKHLNAPARLRVLVEGESLINDGTSIVLLTLILAYVNGAATSGGELLVRFTSIVGGGALVGAVVGFAASRVIATIDDAMIEITLTTIAAYGSFILGEQFHFSGVIATVVAGMVCGNYGRRIGMSPSTQVAVGTFWEYIAFALNSVIFLLIGFEVSPQSLLDSWLVIAIAFVAVALGRSAVILGVTMLLRRTRERIPLVWAAALTWGGLRGALSMVLALALAADFPERSLLVTMTFGVVVASILLQGISMPVVLRRLGLVESGSERLAYDVARGRLQIAVAGASEIDRLRTAHAAPPDLLDALQERYAGRRERARAQLLTLHHEQVELREEAAAATVEHLLLVEKAELIDKRRSGLLRREAFERLVADVNGRLMRLRAEEYEDAGELLTPAEELEDLGASAAPASDASLPPSQDDGPPPASAG